MHSSLIRKTLLLAFVGMPGSGKSEAVNYLKQKGYKAIRFGDLTEKILSDRKLPINAENEQKIREEYRKKFGMDIYARKAENKIKDILTTNKIAIIDGLYSWEEYLFLKNKFEELVLVHIYADSKMRYERLSRRHIRSLSITQAKNRDKAEIENLNKGGPIAIADHMIKNNGTRDEFYKELDNLLERIN